MEVSLPETIVETNVNYAMEINGKFVIIENVPARVCVETGKQLFSPDTVERLQEIIWTESQPSRTIETPVFEFSASC
jgi:YgiT-type zinc finger domain-containing protein